MPYVGWQTRLLPYLDQLELWQQTQNAFQAQAFFQRIPPHTVPRRPMPAFVCPADFRVQRPRALRGELGTAFL